MRQDVECPYCEAWQEINHDDGQGYEEDRLHEQECDNCEKTFVFTTYTSFHYDSMKADCLNGAEHKHIPTFTVPVEYTKMRCDMCGDEREPTPDEMKDILNRATL